MDPAPDRRQNPTSNPGLTDAEKQFMRLEARVDCQTGDLGRRVEARVQLAPHINSISHVHWDVQADKFILMGSKREVPKGVKFNSDPKSIPTELQSHFDFFGAPGKSHSFIHSVRNSAGKHALVTDSAPQVLALVNNAGEVITKASTEAVQQRNKLPLPFVDLSMSAGENGNSVLVASYGSYLSKENSQPSPVTGLKRGELLIVQEDVGDPTKIFSYRLDTYLPLEAISLNAQGNVIIGADIEKLLVYHLTDQGTFVGRPFVEIAYSFRNMREAPNLLFHDEGNKFLFAQGNQVFGYELNVDGSGYEYRLQFSYSETDKIRKVIALPLNRYAVLLDSPKSPNSTLLIRAWNEPAQLWDEPERLASFVDDNIDNLYGAPDGTILLVSNPRTDSSNLDVLAQAKLIYIR